MSDPFVEKENLCLEIDHWRRIHHRLIAGFTTRRGGVSHAPFDTLNLGLHVHDQKQHVLNNRNLLAKKLNIPQSNWVCAEQVHGTNIRLIKQSDQGRGAYYFADSIPQTDGLITDESGILCTAFFADCVPIYFFDPVTSFIGIAHAGWRGSVNNIAGEMVETLISLGVQAKDLHVCIGPCISKTYYENDQRIIDHIDKKYRKNTVTIKDNEHYLLDLKQLNIEMLLQSCILRHNISVTAYCTYANDDLFFSHRRDQGETGRMLGYIGYK